MCIVRKRIVCQCGCRGWCTYYTVCVFVEWCLRCLADGVFPSTRHDGAPFLPDSDSERAQLAGTRMKKRAACIQIRGDWAKFCERLGFPTWQSSYRPCFCCAASRASLYDATGASVFSCPLTIVPFPALRQPPDGCPRFKLGGAVPRTEAQSWRPS